MKMTHQILATQIIVFSVGLIFAWGVKVPAPYIWIAGISWIVFGNVLFLRLKCTRCSKRLMFAPPFMARAFGRQKCAYCGHDHRQE